MPEEAVGDAEGWLAGAVVAVGVEAAGDELTE